MKKHALITIKVLLPILVFFSVFSFSSDHFSFLVAATVLSVATLLAYAKYVLDSKDGGQDFHLGRALVFMLTPLIAMVALVLLLLSDEEVQFISTLFHLVAMIFTLWLFRFSDQYFKYSLNITRTESL